MGLQGIKRRGRMGSVVCPIVIFLLISMGAVERSEDQEEMAGWMAQEWQDQLPLLSTIIQELGLFRIAKYQK